MEPKLMSKKKPSFPVNERFNKYLARYNRNTKIPVFYEDLLRFSGSVVVYDQDDEDTYWVRCYYPEFERVSNIIKNLNPDAQISSNETPPRSGAFEVKIDDELIFSKFQLERFPQESEIKDWF